MEGSVLREFILRSLAEDIGDGDHSASHNGVGAVMGSKKLKAIVLRGSRKIEVAVPEFFNEMASQIIMGLTNSPQIKQMGNWGTAASMDSGWATGDVPVKNWQIGLWREGCLKIGGQKMSETMIKPHSAACYNCPIRCARHRSPGGQGAA